MAKKAFAVFLIGFTAFLFFGGERVAILAGEATAGMSGFLRDAADMIIGIVRVPALTRKVRELTFENQALRAMLFEFAQRNSVLVRNERRLQSAKVYSSYPFNNQSLLTVNAGIREGIARGAAVMVGGESIFLGHVVAVFRATSLVQTIYDEGWHVPVRIGEHGVDALLVGGRRPRLTLIVNDRMIEEGQVVYTAGSDIPYALTIGVVRNIRKEKGAAFQEAELHLLYSAGDIREVFVLIQ